MQALLRLDSIFRVRVYCVNNWRTEFPVACILIQFVLHTWYEVCEFFANNHWDEVLHVY